MRTMYEAMLADPIAREHYDKHYGIVTKGCPYCTARALESLREEHDATAPVSSM